MEVAKHFLIEFKAYNTRYKMGPISGTIIRAENLWLERPWALRDLLLLTFSNIDVKCLTKITLPLLFF